MHHVSGKQQHTQLHSTAGVSIGLVTVKVSVLMFKISYYEANMEWENLSWFKGAVYIAIIFLPGNNKEIVYLMSFVEPRYC